MVRRQNLRDGLGPGGPRYTFGFSLPVRGWFERARLWRRRIRRSAYDDPRRPRHYAQASINEKRTAQDAGVSFRPRKEKEGGNLRKQEHERPSTGGWRSKVWQFLRVLPSRPLPSSVCNRNV